MLALRAEGAIASIVRTIHHVDAFTSQVLLECQRASILDVDHRLCVSQHWADRVHEEFGVESDVVANGVDADRFADCPLDRLAAGRRFGWGDRPVVLAVGGIEPRKGSRLLIEAFARARGRLGDGALLAIGGGETLFDYHEYREAWWGDAQRLGLEVSDGPPGEVPDAADVAILGTIDDEEMPALYRAADALAFPSTREGFGLVVLEALASGIPAVVTDLPVLREHLEDGRDCMMVPAGDSGPLSDALVSAVRDTSCARGSSTVGAETVQRFTWSACAEEHERLYRRMLWPGMTSTEYAIWRAEWRGGMADRRLRARPHDPRRRAAGVRRAGQRPHADRGPGGGACLVHVHRRRMGGEEAACGACGRRRRGPPVARARRAPPRAV